MKWVKEQIWQPKTKTRQKKEDRICTWKWWINLRVDTRRITTPFCCEIKHLYHHHHFICLIWFLFLFSSFFSWCSCSLQNLWIVKDISQEERFIYWNMNGKTIRINTSMQTWILNSVIPNTDKIRFSYISSRMVWSKSIYGIFLFVLFFLFFIFTQKWSRYENR